MFVTIYQNVRCRIHSAVVVVPIRFSVRISAPPLTTVAWASQPDSDAYRSSPRSITKLRDESRSGVRTSPSSGRFHLCVAKSGWANPRIGPNALPSARVVIVEWPPRDRRAAATHREKIAAYARNLSDRQFRGTGPASRRVATDVPEAGPQVPAPRG